MSVALLDVNVLVALLWASHEQHPAALAWFQTHHGAGWATCPLTQAGFVRLSSNPRVFQEAPPLARAVEVLALNLRHPDHRFWQDELPFAQAVAPFARCLTGHQQSTDAYLLGLAMRKRGVLVTFDRGIPALLPSGARAGEHLVILEG